MKTIHLIRHAKSSWKDSSLADVDRPLNKRGVRTGKFMARHLVGAGCCFDHVFCSPALRARATIDLIRQSLETIEFQWTIEPDLYAFDSEALLDFIQLRDEALTDVLIVGHNPALTDLCNQLGHRHIDNIPTCGYAQLTVKEDCAWQGISQAPIELTAFLRPKEFKGV